ncbi:hypothetical protein IAQ61_005338, partial [Plenodomus lingam]|uniref:Predicted protein n=1 Tax=Leptosphaeria maculans (strain JN3 / isolate v23.1.3 / race Av1-4-5-6-7-8) TaxID=985895 RepID=E4ZS17_LEPMJ
MQSQPLRHATQPTFSARKTPHLKNQLRKPLFRLPRRATPTFYPSVHAMDRAFIFSVLLSYSKVREISSEISVREQSAERQERLCSKTMGE